MDSVQEITYCLRCYNGYIHRRIIMELRDKIIQLLETYGPEIRHNGIFHIVTEEIPAKKIDNAIKAYARNADRNTVLALWDLSLLENGKDGYLFTESGVYYPRFLDTPKYIDYSDILSAEIGKTARKDNDSTLILSLSDGTEEVWLTSFLNKTPLKAFFDELIEEVRITRNGTGRISLYDSIRNHKITYE